MQHRNEKEKLKLQTNLNKKKQNIEKNRILFNRIAYITTLRWPSVFINTTCNASDACAQKINANRKNFNRIDVLIVFFGDFFIDVKVIDEIMYSHCTGTESKA